MVNASVCHGSATPVLRPSHPRCPQRLASLATPRCTLLEGTGVDDNINDREASSSKPTAKEGEHLIPLPAEGSANPQINSRPTTAYAAYGSMVFLPECFQPAIVFQVSDQNVEGAHIGDGIVIQHHEMACGTAACWWAGENAGSLHADDAREEIRSLIGADQLMLMLVLGY
ncbi:uncharacterized protein PV07_12447 [Cladophialophora immunda]|uniref:Uncharacterized protein n=1 Tax=Cladophialophora immunda TaxID=569365 RepID=A0A0D1Z3A2_9EURO|nr:uncharacterized protein PV07_12447 [Cladophialophora immunda]KIW22126.1 hypothetical protein PV07_12447 [Cladophialophora immunda]